MKIKLFFLCLFFSSSVFAQVVVTPYVVMIDNKSKFGTYMVINQTNEEQEVGISFQFGHPVSDEIGNVTMKYYEDETMGMNSLDPYIKVFPKKFILRPNEKQVIRMTVSAPSSMDKGTFWTRIITSSQTKQVFSDTVKDLSARINFVLNQITTVMYKNGEYNSNINLKELTVNQDTSFVNLVAVVSSSGDQPFFGNFEYKIYNGSSSLVHEGNEYVSVYFDMKKKMDIPLSALPPGNYTLNLKILSDDSPDIPRSDNSPIIPVEKVVSFTVR